ncbi:MAG: hypothetical protein R3D98_11795 [Candidatus Krumholzibacteriia bacterium]
MAELRIVAADALEIIVRSTTTGLIRGRSARWPGDRRSSGDQLAGAPERPESALGDQLSGSSDPTVQLEPQAGDDRGVEAACGVSSVPACDLPGVAELREAALGASLPGYGGDAGGCSVGR